MHRQPSTIDVFGRNGTRLFLKGVALFNKGDFWESHEVFEDLWRMQVAEVKKLAQGFVQAAAAFSYVKLKRYKSILYLLDKSLEKLQAAVHLLPEVHINLLIQALQAAKAEVQRIGADGLDQFDQALFPHIEVKHSASGQHKGKRTGRREEEQKDKQ